METYSKQKVNTLGGIQKKLILKAYENLKIKGILVYSTCSLEPEEDEGVVSDFLAGHSDAELQKIDFKGSRSPAILEFEGRKYDGAVRNCLRLWPQDNDTEGFFVAKFRKK